MSSSSSSKKKSQKKIKTAADSLRLGKLGWIFWGSAAGITLLALVSALLLPPKEDPGSSPEKEVSALPTQIPLSEKEKKFTYEEKIGTGFDLRIWEADLAIEHTMSELGLDENHILHTRLENKFFYGTSYHFQEIYLFPGNKQEEFVQKLDNNLDRFLEDASLELENEAEQDWSINILGRPTHLLRIGIEPPRADPGTGKLVIIMDDLGESLEYARELARLDFPVTFSILPYLQDTQEVAELGEEKDLEVMLHMPMEPEKYDQGVDPGPGALLTDMTPGEIREQFVHSLQQIPQAEGVNNHMGSAFTQDHTGMEVVFEELQKRDMFFLDSLTTPHSVASKLAEQKNVDYLERQIFLDNVPDKEAILFQLDRAESLAAQYGRAVAIGHPYPETLQALRTWSEDTNPTVKLARLNDLILEDRLRALSSSDSAPKNQPIY